VVPTLLKLKYTSQLEQPSHQNKMMWFSSPCNPSGSVYNREELTALAKVLENILTSLWLQMKSTSTSISQGLLQHCIYPRNARKQLP
jgi:hypothetical protein